MSDVIVPLGIAIMFTAAAQVIVAAAFDLLDKRLVSRIRMMRALARKFKNP